MRFRNSLGSAGLVLSVIALLVALSGGAAVAGGLITANQIKNGAVTGPKIKNNAITGAKVKNGSLTLADFKSSERAKVVGAGGTLNTVYIESPEVTVAAYDIGTAVAFCPAGKKVTGGGYFASIAIPAASQPVGATKNGWGVVINNSDNPIAVEVTAWVVCA